MMWPWNGRRRWARVFDSGTQYSVKTAMCQWMGLAVNIWTFQINNLVEAWCPEEDSNLETSSGQAPQSLLGADPVLLSVSYVTSRWCG